MRAVRCNTLGPPETLVVEDVDEPRPRPDQVSITVHACGVNFPDFLVIQGKYQFKPELPFSPGSEVGGIVRAVGAEVSGFEVGDRVQGFLGAHGGMADVVAVNAGAVLRLPAAVSTIDAAAFLLTYGTSHHALKDRAHLQAGETLLVLGAAGGVGLAAVELGAAMGARVIAAASSAARTALCREHGAHETIDYSREDLRSRIKELTDGRGVDVAYDPVGGDSAELVVRSMAWKGRYLVIGFAAGDIPKIPLNLPLLKGCDLVGVFWGDFVRREPEAHRENVAELMDWWRRGVLRPHVSKAFPLDRAATAITHLAERRATGKVVVVTDAGRAAHPDLQLDEGA